MALSFKEIQAASDIADILYRFLPGSGSPKWKGHISFLSIARDLGIEAFWRTGSKKPAIANLIEKTLEFRRNLFQPLIITIIREGIKYCDKKGEPISAEEIEALNGLILETGFKFPELWDPDFLSLLRLDSKARARLQVEKERVSEKIKVDESTKYQKELQELNKTFLEFHEMVDRQKAGYKFEEFLNRLFELEGLSPRKGFTINNNLEQIDGSFSLDNETYLVEAKWEKKQINREPLSAFRDVIIGKTHITRGVFISISGCTPNAIEALTRGKQPVFFILDGYHLMVVLESRMTLKELLRKYVRKFAEEGLMYITANELY